MADAANDPAWRARLARALLAASLGLSLLGLGAEVAYHRARRPLTERLAGFFSLSYEHNLPTWYSSGLLLACAIALGVVAARVGAAGAPHRRRWWALAGIFAYMSMDEAVVVHEYLGGLLRLGGVLYFSWVVPAAALVALFGAAYLPFLRALPRATRQRFVVAGVIYVGGALGMELPLGWWTERAGDDNLTYALIDLVEESMELAGASLFLLAVLRHLDLLGPAAVAAPARAAAPS